MSYLSELVAVVFEIDDAVSLCKSSATINHCGHEVNASPGVCFPKNSSPDGGTREEALVAALRSAKEEALGGGG